MNPHQVMSKRHYYHDKLRLQCKCEKCGRHQAVPIVELADGQTKCRIHRLGDDECGGQLNYYTDGIDSATSNAVHLLNYLNVHTFFKDKPHLAELLDAVCDDFGCWSESGATPQEMGWVGQDGLP